MGKTLYFDCSFGISGDMAVAALIDLGADQAVLSEALSSLKIGGFKTAITKVLKNGISACDFSVILEHDNYDHDMEYLYGHSEHHQSHNEHHHSHRGINEIREIINSAKIADNAKSIAVRIFEILAYAEAKAHGTDIESVHFHEVGAVDSIVDIIAFSVCLDSLCADRVIIPSLTDGKGFINCQHGIIPVPVPAVVNIAEQQGMRLNLTDYNGELTTPTGAAIAAAVKTDSKLPQDFRIIRQGIGAGKRQYKIPSFLRVFEIETAKGGGIYKLETNIDDCTGEALGYTAQLLTDSGARDVYYTPVFMKKQRPAYVLSVICDEDKVNELEEIIFKNTTTIGIRRFKAERSVLHRKIKEIDTKIGKIKIKECIIDGTVRRYPEYESIKKLCKEKNIPYYEAYSILLAECMKA